MTLTISTADGKDIRLEDGMAREALKQLPPADILTENTDLVVGIYTQGNLVSYKLSKK